MSLAELKSLFESRKWLDCSEKIKSHIAAERVRKDDLVEIIKLLTPVLHRMHPISSSETAVALAPFSARSGRSSCWMRRQTLFRARCGILPPTRTS